MKVRKRERGNREREKDKMRWERTRDRKEMKRESGERWERERC